MTNPFITYYPNGQKHFEEYYVNNKLHRNPSIGPAFIVYRDNGQVIIKEYWFNDKIHRDPLKGPARIIYDINGKIESKSYRFNGKFHNPYGPAYIYYTNNEFTWWLNGIQYTNEVNQYLDKHGYKWQNMDHTDFDIMWTCIL